jgi:N-acetyl sugar amidotransferase
MTLQNCNRCVMDDSCQPFNLDERGFCNHCEAARQRLDTSIGKLSGLDQLVRNIKSRKIGEFDCVVGVSGGLDSSYLLVKAKEIGLNPLAVHMDNNWNSSMATHNLRQILDKLKIPLVTVVTDWNAQKAIQRALMESDVIDIELLYDNALHAVCYKVAREHRIKTILGGANLATEGVEVPASWVWRKFDGKNLKSIAKQFHAKTSGYPIFSSWRWLVDTVWHRISWVSLLDYLDSYGRTEALDYLRDNFGYVPYGQKHYENVFTRFYQGHILPKKFGVDKRKPHLSSEIIDGKMTREQALEVLSQPIYSSDALLRLDYEYVCEKLEITDMEMQNYLNRPRIPHDFYASERWISRLISLLLRTRRLLKKVITVVR